MKRKIAITSLAASLAIPVTDITATENTHQNSLYGTPVSLMNLQQARLNMQHSQLSIRLSDYLEEQQLNQQLNSSVTAWQKILTDDVSRKQFATAPLQTLQRLGFDDEFYADNYESISTLRLLLSADAQVYLQQGDIKGYFNLLKNYGIIKSSYPELKRKLKLVLKNKEIFEQKSTGNSPEELKLQELFDNDPNVVVVANLVIMINVGFAVNVAVVSNVYSALAVHSDAIVHTNSSISGGCSDINKCKVISGGLSAESIEKLNMLERISHLDPALAQTTRILLSGRGENSDSLASNIEELVKLQVSIFTEALLESDLLEGNTANKPELEALLNKIIRS